MNSSAVIRNFVTAVIIQVPNLPTIVPPNPKAENPRKGARGIRQTRDKARRPGSSIRLWRFSIVDAG